VAKDKVSIEISVEERAALKALTRLTKGVDKFEKESIKAVKSTDKAWSSFRGNLGAIAASGAIKAIASGLSDLVTGSIAAAASAEKINTQLEILTGSTEAAAALFKELTEFSAGTPFQLQGIAEASAQLLSFGFEADTVIDRIGMIGEVAAGSNSDLKEVALIYGQVAAAGKLTGERLLQFQERAIPIGAALAKSLGVAESEVKDLVSAGVVGFPEIKKAFNSMGEAGGLFEGAIKKQSRTLNGVVSTMKDNFFILQQTIGETFREDLVVGANVIIEAIQDMTKAVIANKDAIAIALGFVKDYIGVYAQLAVQAVGTETPLQKLDAQLLKLIDGQQRAIKSSREAKSSMGEYMGLFDKDKRVAIERAANNIARVEREIRKLQETRKAMVSGVDEDFVGPMPPPKLPPTPPEDPKILAQRKQLHLELLMLEQDKLAKDAEMKLAQKELGTEERQIAIESLKEHELIKAEIVNEIQADKDSKIRDKDAARFAAEKRNQQLSIAQAQASAKAKKAMHSQELADEQAFFSKAISLSSSKNKDLAAIGKAAGLVQIAMATPPAIASSFNFGTRIGGPVLGAVFGGIAAAAQAEQAAKMAGFANGGVIGGTNGAVGGNDNTTFKGRVGEMMLNAPQQRRLFDIADGNDNRQSEDRNLELTVITQIDEREIARSLRNQRLEGFAI